MRQKTVLNLPAQSCLRGTANCPGDSQGFLPLAATLQAQWSPCGSTMGRGHLWEERDSLGKPHTLQSLRGCDPDPYLSPFWRVPGESEPLITKDTVVISQKALIFQKQVQQERLRRLISNLGAMHSLCHPFTFTDACAGCWGTDEADLGFTLRNLTALPIITV